MRKVLVVTVLALSAGCIHLVGSDPWLKPVDAMAAPAAKPAEADVGAAWRGEADPWAGVEKVPGDVIGGDSAFEKKGAEAAGDEAAAGAVVSGDVERELRVLSARVDRLERLVDGGAGRQDAAPSRPGAKAVAIYKVHPGGQTAWIAAGSRAGMKQGQTLEILRDGKAVAQAQVARVWPDVSELNVLWANGKLQRGDSVVPR